MQEAAFFSKMLYFLMLKAKFILFGAIALFSGTVLFGFMVFASLSTQPATGPTPRAQGIVALTGETQRIKAAGKLLRARRAGRLLISGVNRVVSKAELRGLLAIENKLFNCCVDIGYAAQNTRGNAEETRDWARENKFDSIIVVTSSYHMPRSLTELGHLLPAVDFVAHPVVPDRFRDSPWWLDRRNLMLLGAEYLKYLPSAVQFRVGRIIGTPRRSKRDGREAIVQKAVAIQ